MLQQLHVMNADLADALAIKKKKKKDSNASQHVNLA